MKPLSTDILQFENVLLWAIVEGSLLDRDEIVSTLNLLARQANVPLLTTKATEVERTRLLDASDLKEIASVLRYTRTEVESRSSSPVTVLGGP